MHGTCCGLIPKRIKWQCNWEGRKRKSWKRKRGGGKRKERRMNGREW